jgi:subtilase family serine protease
MKLIRTLALLFVMLTSLTIVLFAGFTETMAQTVAAQQSPSAQAQAKRSVNPLAVFPKDRILQRINRSATVTLTGHVHRRAQAEFDAGPVAGDAKMPGMILVLKRDPEQQEALDAFSAALQDPSSPMYQQWLTPAEFGLHFGVSQNDLDQVMSWLRSEGFTIDDVPAGHWMIVFSGTAAQVENAFHAGIRNYRIGENVYYANSQDPRVPEALSGVVQSISGLHNFPPVPASGTKIVPDAVNTSGQHGLFPSDFATIYNLNPLYTSGYNGSGVNIAVIAPCAAAATVLPVAQAFWTLEQLSSASSSYWNYGTPAACTSSSGFLTEAELDVEWSGAVAQGAKIWLVSSNAADPLFGAITGIVNSGVGSSNTFVPVISMSYGEPEIPSIHQAWNSLWQQAHVSGITGVVGSGDSGAAGADGANSTTAIYGLVINGLCASPYVVCVGGTQFNDASNPGQYWSSGGAAHRATYPRWRGTKADPMAEVTCWLQGAATVRSVPSRVGRQGIQTSTGECRMSRFQPRRTMDTSSV